MTEPETPMRRQVRAVVRAVVRASAPRPASAVRAATNFNQGFWPALWSEIRWAFTPPRTWLSGVVANLCLAVAWLAVQPLASHGHQTRHYHHHHLDWVVLVSTYFSSFVLADVTTTNVLGGDHYRVVKGLAAGTPLWRVLLIKNMALLVLVGMPTLVVAMALTLQLESPQRLAVTIPNVAVPILSWLGVGNLVSVLHPVAAEPLIRRWRQRHDLRRTSAWLAAVTLPYAVYYVADPMDGVEHKVFWTQLPAAIGPVLGRDTKSFVHLGFATAVWIGGTVAAEMWVRKRGLQMR
ncbi:hypothetical protein MKUB_24050 [Mycobacterium kubicae]|uniref:ABC transporter permease n=1 Tax=Mycobacterium kubicae TaxID=120959 RepID=A0AAX1JIK5_9MYCO|nr:hypothetical protein [Mycobacterium kubicae]MCV7093894.1 hypothetical protein [Mycobacterium kubicae]QPI40193.1 hypothetical protein I2456_12635 [Mycobacterium kubicae]GFG64915.1 hypothetical protein MKUB_24050 [Mycobacterium kubicae]